MAAALPYNIYFTNITATSAVVHYMSGTNSWQTDISLYSNSGSLFWERYQACSPVQEMSYTITGLSADTTYYIKLRSIDSGGNWDGTYTDSIYFTTAGIVIPGIPTSLNYTLSYGNVILGWTNGSNTYRTHYRVYRASDNYLWGYGYVTDESQNQVVYGLQSNTQYYFMLRSESYSGGFSDWTSSVYFTSMTSPTCAAPTSVDAIWNASTFSYDVTVGVLRGFYKTWIEYTTNGADWGLIAVVDDSELTDVYYSHGVANASINVSNFGNGAVFQFRAFNTRREDNWYDSACTYSNNYTLTKPTCPVPTSLTAAQSGYTTSVTATAASGYNIYLEYYDNVWYWKTTQASPLSTQITISDLGRRYVLHLRAKCTRSNYEDSDYIYLDVLIAVRPSNSTYFNFISGQSMTAENVIKVSNGQYTADAVVMSASVWNAFKDSVNAFREYRGYVAFTPAYTVLPGTVFTASIYNDMADAITQVLPGTDSIPHIASQSNITAAILMLLQSKLNSIP